MKFFFKYLKQRRMTYFSGMLFFAVFIISFKLYHLPVMAVVYPFFLCFVIACIFTAADFMRVKRRHEELNQIKSITDAIENTFPKIRSIEDGDYREIIRLISEEHSKTVSDACRDYADMIDYYTVWAHQIKTPIASMRLSLQSEDSPMSRRLSLDLHRIEQYVEMVLTFLRLNSQSSDYVIKDCDLDTVIRQAARRFSGEFIARKLSFCYEPTDISVLTDEKWLSFVVEQVLSNALKYTQSGSITVSVDKNKRLKITDTGIGIAPGDLPRIFEKGYTGAMGRTDKRASGLGLYLCKRICENLGHGIWAESTLGEGTAVTVDLDRKSFKAE